MDRVPAVVCPAAYAAGRLIQEPDREPGREPGRNRKRALDTLP